jgi:hypothetical protein
MQKNGLLVEVGTNKGYFRLDWGAECSILQTKNTRFHGTSLSPILVVRRCKYDFSKTFGGAKRVLWQSTDMCSCNRWQIIVNGVYHYF